MDKTFEVISFCFISNIVALILSELGNDIYQCHLIFDVTLDEGDVSDP